MVGTQLETASLREDYLNQVQRDFLSRCRLAAAPTPLAKWPVKDRGPKRIINEPAHQLPRPKTKQPADLGLSAG